MELLIRTPLTSTQAFEELMGEKNLCNAICLKVRAHVLQIANFFFS